MTRKRALLTSPPTSGRIGLDSHCQPVQLMKVVQDSWGYLRYQEAARSKKVLPRLVCEDVSVQDSTTKEAHVSSPQSQPRMSTCPRQRSKQVLLQQVLPKNEQPMIRLQHLQENCLLTKETESRALNCCGAFLMLAVF